MVFLRFPFKSGIQCVSFEDGFVKSEKVHQRVASYLGSVDFSLIHNGRKLLQDECIPQDATVLVTFPLPGGKGGFGSMLRAIGAQIEKTTNREACRDLSGRRLRDINEEQRLKKWISKESEREAEKVARRKARIERLKSKPKHNFNDFEYEKKLSEAPERVDEAITAALEKKNKRPAPEAAASCSGVKPKKKHLWLGDDISSSSDSESETGNSDSREATNSDTCEASEKPGCSSTVEAQIISDASSSSDSTRPPAESSQECVAMETDKSSDLKDETSQSSGRGTAMSTKEKSSEDSTLNGAEVKPAIEESQDTSPLDPMSYDSPSHLESAGLERLKAALLERGLKCGGSLQDRAQRLWLVRDLDASQYPPALLAKKKK